MVRKNLLGMLKELDENNSGTISREEMRQVRALVDKSINNSAARPHYRSSSAPPPSNFRPIQVVNDSSVAA